MSVTEWVLYRYNSDDNGLEEAKNFVFIWGLFESQLKNVIGNLNTLDFKSWGTSLEITQETIGIVITEPRTENCINGKLVDDINKAFNHFYQLYINDAHKFINHLYNQADNNTQKAKARFLDFAMTFNKRDIRDKIVFLFHIAKRMRNKFFHGIKNIGEILNEQKEFSKINVYLIAILSLIEQYN
ncbi:hypothetical protein [Evansella cellulosilytica]|uniref:Apea-like HEPN domain-containing protein n=1 Tax=Evansella cellulosilytica (strain ATCC 21833 / DSM 2522 / FERM P-1141 / JCM 9156 / N-4) TaxID=649639 RepID=E6TR27_EVAC2|nr:hypothetical protein [Evansella cellulosilytica]ADU29403.1 hypothetical protein Bcell_1134 [Evansella cellulosilytica DSM 2522]